MQLLGNCSQRAAPLSLYCNVLPTGAVHTTLGEREWKEERDNLDLAVG